MHSKTNQIRYTKPPSSKFKRTKSRSKPPPPKSKSPQTQHRKSIDNDKNNGNNNNSRTTSISHRRTASNQSSSSTQSTQSNPSSHNRLSPRLDKQKSSTPPPPNNSIDLLSISSAFTSKISSGHIPSSNISHKSPPKKSKKSWGIFGRSDRNKRNKKPRSRTEGVINWTAPDRPTFKSSTSEQINNNQNNTSKKQPSLPSYVIIDDHFNNNQHNKKKSKSKLKINNKRGRDRSNTSINRIKTSHHHHHHQSHQSLESGHRLDVTSSHRLSIHRIPSTTTNMKRERSKYDIDPDADITKVLHGLLGYDILDLNESMNKNIYIKSNIDSILSYRYQSLSLSHIKQFTPPLNDKLAEIKYFRNIQYPQYKLDTNTKITQIINQNIYDFQTPYLRIRIPLNIIRDIFGNKNLLNKNKSIKLSKLLGSDHNDDNADHEEKKTLNETFNIELSNNDKDILSTTVQQFFHSITKQTSGIKQDDVIQHMFCGMTKKSVSPSLGSPQTSMSSGISASLGSPDMLPLSEASSTNYIESMHNDRYDWSKLAIKAKGLEEYIFYSTDPKDKICNYECVRYALSHQLDKNDNKSYLTLVYLDDFDEQINKLKKDYIDYEQHINLWRSNVTNICETKQQFKTAYPWLNVINKQFNEYPHLPQLDMDEMEKKHESDIDYVKMNDPVYEWKNLYDKTVNDNNIVLLQQYKCLFEYTIHSIINTDKLPRYRKDKYNDLIVSFELQIGHLSYEQDIWLTPPKKGNKIEFKKAIYKSKHLRINTFPREIILSIIVFGIPKITSATDIYSTVYSAKSDNVPSWFPSQSSTGTSSDFNTSYTDLDMSSNGWTTYSNGSSGTTSKSSSPHLILKEDPIDLRFKPNYNDDNDEQKTPSMGTPTTRRRQYSYGSASDKDGNNINFDKDNHDDNREYKGVFHRAFSKCDALAYLRIPLIDEFHTYKQGTFTYNLWDIPKWKKTKHSPRDPFGHDLLWRFIKPCSIPPTQHSATNMPNQSQITITIGPNPENNPDYSPPVAIAPLFNHIMKPSKTYDQVICQPREKFSAKEYKKMDSIVRYDPLTTLTKKEKLLIWVAREKLSKTKPRALPVFLSCVDWRNPYFRSEAYKYLYKWKLPNLLSDLVELLAAWRFPDNRIKHFVITQALNKLSDIQIKHILLQLTQIVKLEPHNTSFTSNFLIQRALRSVTRVGHYLFWFLKTEMDASYTTYTRFTLILEDFLLHCFSYPHKLYIQNYVVGGLKEVSNIVRNGKKNKQPTDELKARMHHILRRMNKSLMKIENGVSIALNPKYKLKQLIINKCKFMGSAQAPLWLAFENCDIYSNDLLVLFKSGDDLRQDFLTLQIMDTMNQLWLTSGYCMRFRIYKVITTGATTGFIEIVTNSRTFNDLAVNLGGGIVSGPKDETVHVKYLKNTHPSKYNVKLRKAAQDRYLRSAAGYCIASWIIGIGDRHSDNIMVHECGDLFHIDFGHFLGHFKVKKIKIIKFKTEWQRERSPFVFLPAMKYCIKYDFENDKPGIKDDELNENYQRFIDLCTRAMDAIRRRQRAFLNLFSLMIPSQMPELLKQSDIEYMKTQMWLKPGEKTENYESLRQHVKKELDDSVNDGVRIFDHIVHAYVHSK